MIYVNLLVNIIMVFPLMCVRLVENTKLLYWHNIILLKIIIYQYTLVSLFSTLSKVYILSIHSKNVYLIAK